MRSLPQPITPGATSHHFRSRLATILRWVTTFASSTAVAFSLASLFIPGPAMATAAGGATAGDRDDDPHGYLGVTMEPITGSLRKALNLKGKEGILIDEVLEDTPAEAAGLEDGDVLVRFAGKKVDSPRRLRKLVTAAAPGDKVKVRVIRKGKPKNLNVVIGEAPDKRHARSFRGSWHPRMWGHRGGSGPIEDHYVFLSRGGHLGVEVTGLNDDLATYFKVEPGKGVLVLSIISESVGEAAGLKAGDVIVKLGGEAVTSVDELIDAVRELEADQAFTISIVRQGQSQSLEAEMKAAGDMSQSSARHLLRSLRLPGMVWWDGDFEDEDGLHEELDELKDELDDLRDELEQLRGN